MHLELWIPTAGRMRFTLLPVILGAALAMVPCVATAGTITAEKFIIWDFKTAPDDNAKGTFGWILKAKVDDEKELKSDSSKNWKLKDGLPDDTETSGQAGPTSKGSSAKSDMTFSAKPDMNANPPFNPQYDAEIATTVQADTAKDKGGSASASSSGSINIPGGKISAVSKFDPDNRNGKIIDKTKFSGLGATTEGKGSWHDPISLNLLNLATNQLLTEDLLGMDIEFLGVGAMSWDSNGFLLSAPLDGSSSVSFSLQVLSSWITDPNLVSSTLSLSNGAFQATGVFAGLPWVITPGQVSLPAGFLDSISIPYQIPLGAFNSTDDYLPSLTLTEGAQVSEGVPEPSYAVLLAIALAALVARARRTPRREAAETPYIGARANQERRLAVCSGK